MRWCRDCRWCSRCYRDRKPSFGSCKSWEERTGGKVRVIQSPFVDLYSRYIDSITAKEPKYDVLLYASAWAGDFFPYLQELPAKLGEDESFDDIHPVYRDRLMRWDGKWIAVTVDGDMFNGYYRKDLFENSANQKTFSSRYGYPLAPPDSWEQYRDIAEFFTGYHDADGNSMFGTAEAFAYGGQQVWTVFSRASAYLNDQKTEGRQFFDTETMRAQVNNPGWQRAVQDYVDVLKFSPPEAINFGIVEARDAFLAGKTAMILDWGYCTARRESQRF
ncbi:ABC transporter substrate-binding protein [Candidatus Reidiella endopervernicosa]|uniref:Extracellular solute-binding protein n=1 Tax=Candidatus Reidiella endopervernicosa TaxID=2738883 RepID=A0A6N0I107_9GAMM|nr:extracellular solute-binding protein [Candidatus Reidiella endopervernicosa]QKQ28330.1 extracellular solute-binding protein [Candidatus Reidiella endopervernicosa]